MVNFFPNIYKDEMLYSVIARYQRMSGITSTVELSRELFNKDYMTQSAFFPKHLKTLIKKMPFTSKITTREIIINHTLFPIYSAFMSEEKAEIIESKMTEGVSPPPESYFGFSRSNVKNGDYLKYCPVCFAEDNEILGESYWRRIHQVVGTLYCMEHQVLLKESTVVNFGKRFGYICADTEVCSPDIEKDTYISAFKELNLRYISNVEYLLKGNYQRKTLPVIISTYIDILRERKLASKAGNLYLNQLQNDFLEYYSNKYLKMMQSEVDIDQEKNWLRSFVRNDGINKSILRHLLYTQFLGISVEEFFNIKQVTGKTPIAYNHKPQFDIDEKRKQWLFLIESNKEANRSQLKKLGKGLNTWITRYDREWYEKVSPKPIAPKPRSNFVDWEERDEECLKLAKDAVDYLMNLPDKPVRVTTASVIRVVGNNKYFSRNRKLIKTHEFMRTSKETPDKYRLRVIGWAIKEMIKSGEYLTPYQLKIQMGIGGGKEVTSIIEKELELYEEVQWLNRINQELVSKRNERKEIRRTNWDKRDQKYYQLAKKAYETLLTEKGKPQRITKLCLLRTMGVTRWSFNRKFMKKTDNYFEEVLDDNKTYRTRKIRWAIEEMKEFNLPVTADKVKIYAGFGGGSKEVRELIKLILKEYK